MVNKYLIIAIALLAAAAANFAPVESVQARAVLSVTVFVVILWMTEVLPLHITALIVAFLLATYAHLPEKAVLANYFDPVIMLLLGGFVIAVAMTKHGLDKYFAYKIMGRMGNKPHAILFGIIFSTAFISMWISNTAAAALMMPVAVVILVKNGLKPLKSNFGKAAVLAVAYGATIGGIGTIIGSTPNIIAAKYLSASGNFGFFEWFYRGFPFMLAMTVVGWLVLLFLFRSKRKELKIIKLEKRLGKDQKIVIMIFVATIALWMTESVHGVSNANVAIVPIILLYVTGMLASDDFLKIDWESLILVGGGLALGYGIHASGLDSAFVGVIQNMASTSPFALFLMLGFFGVLLTSFISNTTASSLYIPIVVALASVIGISPANTVVVASIGVSLDFIFPFGTPPSAIAYSTKYVRMRDMAKTGMVISVIGTVLLAAMALLW